MLSHMGSFLLLFLLLLCIPLPPNLQAHISASRPHLNTYAFTHIGNFLLLLLLLLLCPPLSDLSLETQITVLRPKF